METDAEKISWEMKVALGLGATSLLLYLVDFVFLRDWRSLWASALTNLAFLPISVIVITLIIDRLLSVRDRSVRLERLNMLISAFFSHLGTGLLTMLAARDGKCGYLLDHFGTAEAWEGRHLRETKQHLSGHSYELSVNADDFSATSGLLFSEERLSSATAGESKFTRTRAIHRTAACDRPPK
jgi:hypothetical protein